MANQSGDTPAIAGPFGAYSQFCRIPAGSTFVQTAGQVGVRKDGSMPESIEEECFTAMSNVLAVLASAGFEPKDITKFGIFLLEPDHVRHYRAARDRLLGDFRPPATLLIVQALAQPQWRVEIEACAARGA